MSISDEISRITNARDDIGDAIEEMGVEVPSGTQIDGMASLIRTGVTGHIQNYNNPHQVTPEQIGAANADILIAPTQTASGPMVSFTADIHSILNECAVNIEPVQDLHGYDYPWPAGGGKNLFNKDTVVTDNAYINATTGATGVPSSSGGTWRYSDYIPVTPGDVLYFGEVNTTASVAGTAFYSTNAVSGYISGFSATQLWNASNIYTVPSGAAYMRHSFRIDTGYNINWQNTVYIIKNSDAHEWTPYSNICPISGRNKINIWSTSKNLFKENLIALGIKQTINGVTFEILESGKILPSGTVTGSDAILKLGTVTLPPGEYKAYGIDGVDGSSSTYRLVITNSAFTQAVATVTTSSGAAFTLTKTTTIGYQIVISVGVTVNYTNVVFTPMILVSTDTPGMFGRYAGTQYPITFPSSAGTIYGGTLDVANGVLTVNRAIVDLGTLNWAQYRTVRGWYAGFNKIKVGTNKIKCTSYRSVASSTDSSFFGDSSNDKCINTYLNSQGLRIMDTAYEDTVIFKASLSGVQLVYELETPIVYNITARQIYYYPTSRIWTDADSIQVRYQATGRNALLTHVSTPVSNLQGQINISGLLKSNGDGDIVTAIPGQDYAVSKNLLRNWYFAGGGTGRGVLPVNQRGFTTSSGTNHIWSIDGWYINGGYGMKSLQTTGFYINNNATSGNATWQQWFGTTDSLSRKTVTLSAVVDDVLHYYTATVPQQTSAVQTVINYTIKTGVAMRLYALALNSGAYEVQFYCAPGYTALIKAVKLEFGSEQTLAHPENGVWVLNEIPDYEEELIKCQTSTEYSPADYPDIYANKVISTNVSKPNLLRNWYFVGGGTGRGVFPVNQRGQSSYTAPGGVNYYTVDGWFIYTTNTPISINSGYLTLGPMSNSSSSITERLYIPFKNVANKQMTISCLLGDGSLLFASNTIPATAPSSNTSLISAYGPSGSSGYFVRLGYNNGFYFIIQTIANVALNIVAVKLELGTEQTLAHQENGVWVLNEIPDYEEELIKCQTSTAISNDTYANKSLATEQQIAPIETRTTANRAYAVGECFCWNGLLYRAKTAIASGASFTPGTNCETTTVMSAITANWTPVNATTPYANRNYFFKSGKFIMIAVCIQLSSNLNAGQEREILSSVLSACGVQINPNQMVMNMGIAFLSSSNDIPIRIIFNGGKLYVRNQSGTMVDTSRIIYGQIVLGIQ